MKVRAKVIAVTGAGNGIGRELALHLRGRPSREALPKQILERFGTIDGVINNAGIIQPFCRLNDREYSAIERVLNVNLYGTLFVTNAFLPHLLGRPEAHIANVSSMGGFVPVPGQTMYCAAKAAIKLMSEGLASELRDTTVRVTVVFPGAVAAKPHRLSSTESNVTLTTCSSERTQR